MQYFKKLLYMCAFKIIMINIIYRTWFPFQKQNEFIRSLRRKRFPFCWASSLEKGSKMRSLFFYFKKGTRVCCLQSLAVLIG